MGDMIKMLRACQNDHCVCDECAEGSNVKSWRRLMGIAADALEARAPRWISVNERLPEEGVLVLTRDRYGNIRNRSLFVFSDETKVFRPDGVLPGKHITHWMPLPEAPEEG